jgi:hypothetical protein
LFKKGSRKGRAKRERLAEDRREKEGEMVKGMKYSEVLSKVTSWA